MSISFRETGLFEDSLFIISAVATALNVYLMQEKKTIPLSYFIVHLMEDEARIKIARYFYDDNGVSLASAKWNPSQTLEACNSLAKYIEDIDYPDVWQGAIGLIDISDLNELLREIVANVKTYEEAKRTQITIGDAVIKLFGKSLNG